MTKTNKIPSRGPFALALGNGTIEVWYDAQTRNWVVQQKDGEGNQIGPGYEGTAVYVYSRSEAVDEVKSVMAA